MSTDSVGLLDSMFPAGPGRVRPRACVVDSRRHTRAFLQEALEDAGFMVSGCGTLTELSPLESSRLPNLVVLCVSPDATESAEAMQTLARANFQGEILLLAPRDLPALAAVCQLGQELGLALLPPVATPFTDQRLRASVAPLLGIQEPICPPVDVAAALEAGWLEMWYQPKVNAQSLCFDSAEALVRMDHPHWGIVSPAYFIPDDSDPHFRAFSEFVIGRAIENWQDWVPDHGHVELAINLPVEFLRSPQSLDHLCERMPVHPAFGGMIVEVNGTEVLRNLDLMKEVAARVRFHNIGIAIDDLGAEWTSLLTNAHFPFVEIKVDRKFVAGCANDPLKRSICRHILDFANSVGSRSIAEGVETREDFLCVRDMGFDIVQGFLFARPMPAHRFEQYLLNRGTAPREYHWHPVEGLVGSHQPGVSARS